MFHKNPDLENLYTRLLNGWPVEGDEFVPGEGPAPCKVMFVGEAPGSAEVRANSPIAGRVGDYFGRLLGLSGVKRDEVFVTNAVKFYRPNRKNLEGKPTIKPSNSDIQESISSFKEEVEIVSPKLIVTMGTTPLSLFFSSFNINEARKEIREKAGHSIFSTYHPAIVVASGQKKMDERLKHDFRVIGNYIRSIT